jgi:hypothetical protein
MNIRNKEKIEKSFPELINQVVYKIVILLMEK